MKGNGAILRVDGEPDGSIATSTLEKLIRRDQLEAARLSLPRAIVVNMLLGFASTMVAAHAGRWREGLAWYSVCLVLNLLRLGFCRATCHGLSPPSSVPSDLSEAGVQSIEKHLRILSVAALLSGTLWATLPILSDGYTSAQTLFYLTVTCGITAGAVTHGIAFARIPICFITPPLLSAAACLFYAGGFDRVCLAATALLYLGGLVRGVIEAETNFRATSRLKHQATALALSREQAHLAASALAEEMRRRATHDDLSGLLNRAGFLQDAEERLLDRASAHCLMLLDLDGFKSVNDVYGHKTGDRVLVEVAKRMKAALHPNCIVARLGGDEFAILYEPAQVCGSPSDLASRLIRAVREPFEAFDAGRLGMSVGIYQATASSLTHMLSCADCALYAAKDAGRNHYRIFDAKLRSRLDMRRDCERDLSQALESRNLEVWFQPIFRQDGRIATGLEALVRWRHPVHGWIPPNDLIADAAIAGLADRMLRFILEGVCSMMSTLRDRGLSSLRVSMNVSPSEMAQVAVDEIILKKLGLLGLPADMLEIEITEETMLDIDAVQAKLLVLSRAGVRVALDDFGSGYSSLAALRQLRAGRIKIDRSLVTELSSSSDKKGMVQAVLSLGRTLGIEVVAEGVETPDDLETLQALGCQLMQGYYLGRPAPPHEALRMVATSLVEAA